MIYLKYIVKAIFVLLFGFLFLIALLKIFANVRSLIADKSLDISTEDAEKLLFVGTDNKKIANYLLGNFVAIAFIAAA